jgi:hypothetical protein
MSGFPGELMQKRTAKIAALCAALLVVACDSTTEPPLGPGEVRGTDGRRYQLVEGQMSAAADTASKWIGPEGGTLELLGEARDSQQTKHFIVVPEGAVQENTLFTLTLASAEYLSVELRAQVQLPNGQFRDIGAYGFLKRIQVFLSYAWATNLDETKSLTILWDPKNGNAHEKVGGTTSRSNKQVMAELGHFSKYSVALD